ncbi:MAG: metal-dependent hydrolase [Bacteroidota bacterium]
MEITYYGHSSFEVSVASKKLLFDPFITPNELAKDVNIQSIVPDYILLSHGHADHVADVERIYANGAAKIISNFEVVTWFQTKGLDNVHPMNHGGSWRFDFGRVKMVSAVHSSSMPDGSYGGNAIGFVIEADGITFYYAGDTALTLDMQLIKEEFDIDFAFLPIGDNFTMDIHDAFKAAKFVGTNKVVAMHFDTFPYIEIDKEAVKKLASQNDVELILPEIGNTFKI